jgi:hypothetical protein
MGEEFTEASIAVDSSDESPVLVQVLDDFANQGIG